MSPRRACAALLALLTLLVAAGAQASPVLVMDGSGRVRPRADPYVGEAAPQERRAPRAAGGATARASAAPRTPEALGALLQTGAIDQPTYDRALGAFRRVRLLAGRLRGARRGALRGVLGDVEGMARRGAIRADRLPALVETLERNARWWTRGPLLAPGARVSFSDSNLVWQAYPGHGIQIQWLATWGRANGLWAARDSDAQLAALVGEAVSLASQRAGGIGFEYLFAFDGGEPPWVSGLAQGTALTALVRAGLRLRDPAWFDAARAAVGIFRVAPPEGVAQPTAAGTHYLQYSFAPRLHVLNGFIQSLNGLFDYARVLDDPEGRRLFAAGRAEAAAELPRFDTGGWARYSDYSDSSLHYFEVLRGFLANLCIRLKRNGLDDEPFCMYAARFLLYKSRDPEIRFDRSGAAPRARRPARVRFDVDKPATVTLAIHRGGRLVRRTAVAVSSGRHALRWRPPRAGTYTIELSARDLLGNFAAVSTAAIVRPG